MGQISTIQARRWLAAGDQLHDRPVRIDLVDGLITGLTPDQALRLMTVAGAWLTFDETVKGPLAPGYYADLAVLSRDPLDTLCHFGCRAARKSHQQNAPGVGTFNDQMRNAMSKGVGFA